MIEVLFVGESWSVTEVHTKGFDSFTTSHYVEGGSALREALSSDGFRLTYMPSHVAANAFPSTREELDAFDVVIFSDIGSNTLLMPASVFLQGQQAPNRLDLLAAWTRDGGGFAMVGGYMSFQGIEGKANYGNTAIAGILPVTLMVGDDRVEAPQGAVARAVGGHQITSGVGTVWPALLGYQRLVPRPDATVLAAFDADPLLVVGEHGRGRTLAFASDVDVHWAPTTFTIWEGFGELWRNSVRWLAHADDARPSADMVERGPVKALGDEQ